MSSEYNFCRITFGASFLGFDGKEKDGHDYAPIPVSQIPFIGIT